MKIFAQKLLVGRTFLANQTVTVEDGQITAIGGGGPADFSVWALTPGLVDLHCHGGQGFDPELNERPLPEFLTILLCHGVTDVLLTLGAEPLPTMRRALAVVQTAMQQQAAGKLPGAHILGVHLEGPFLSPERPGAMPPAALLPPTLAAYQTLVQGYESVIRQVTLAPELPGALDGEISTAAFCDAAHTQLTVMATKQNLHHFAELQTPATPVELEVALDAAPKSVEICRIDEEHGNPLKCWQLMGEPEDLTPAQVQQITAESAVTYEKLPFTYENGAAHVTFSLGTNDIAFVRFVK